jgi:hypothetical protein
VNASASSHMVQPSHSRICQAVGAAQPGPRG